MYWSKQILSHLLLFLLTRQTRQYIFIKEPILITVISIFGSTDIDVYFHQSNDIPIIIVWYTVRYSKPSPQSENLES